MKHRASLFIMLMLTGCGINPDCHHACSTLRSVKFDSEGYLPRDDVFKAVGISEADLQSPSMSLIGGTAILDCGCWFVYVDRIDRTMSELRSIDEILDNPEHNVSTLSEQLEHAVIIDKKTSREICRLDSPVFRRKRVVAEKQAEQVEAPDS